MCPQPDDLLLHTGDPCRGYGMGDAADIRVVPATIPDLLAGVVGKRLTYQHLIGGDSLLAPA